MSLNSAEGITKYLRNKNTTIKDLVAVSNELANNEMQVYFPNKEIFIFQLLVDRLNDSKLKEFRKNREIWMLFNKIWKDLNNEIRTKLFNQFKFGEIIIDALENELIFDVIIDTFKLFNGVLNNLDDFIIEILNKFMINLNKQELDDRDDLVLMITKLYKLNSKTMNNKFNSKLISVAFPNILNNLQLGHDVELIKLIKSIIANSNSIVSNTELLLSTSAINEIGISNWFKLLLSNSSIEIPIIEEIYTKITETLPNSSINLFKYLNEMNKTLSLDFLLNIFNKEFEMNNYEVVLNLLKLNIEIGIKNIDLIIIKLSEKDEISYGIIEELINSFIKGREIDTFIQKWEKFIKGDVKITQNDQFSELVSDKVKLLSLNQIKAIIESTEDPIILSSIVYGLFNFKESKESLIALLKPLIYHKNWKLNYYLLTLFDELLDESELLTLSKSPTEKSIYYYFTIFRIRELIDFDLTFITEFIKFLKKNKEYIELTMNRWFVLINYLFTKKEIDEFVKLLNVDLVLKTLNNDLFEQFQITDSIIQNHSVYQTVPIQCYSKKIRPVIIEKLTKQVLKNKEESTLNTIIHLLEIPTFKTSIETDAKTIIKVIELFPTSNVINIIVNHHVKNIKIESSLNYLNSLISILKPQLKDSLNASYYITFTILLQYEEDIQLKEALISGIKSIISKQSNVWVLNCLLELEMDEVSFNSILPSLISAGNNKDREIKLYIYLIYCKYSKYLKYETEYYQALYVNLREEITDYTQLLKGFDSIVKSDSSFIFLLKQLPNEFIFEMISSYWKSLKDNSLFIKSLSYISTNIQHLNHPIIILTSLREILVNKSSLINQYSLELIISIVSKVSITSSNDYTAMCLIISNILLFHRFRLSNRHHLIMSIFDYLLLQLIQLKDIQSTQAFTRLLSNLCEPNTNSSSSNNSLVSTQSSLKSQLRKYVHVLLINYINYQLKYSFNPINEYLIPGIYTIFDVLSKDELVLISTSLDYSGRSYYKSLYDDYKKVGKWQTD